MNFDSPTPIRTDADLLDLWRTLMGPLGFSRTTLWMVPIGGDDLPDRLVLPIDHVPTHPTVRDCDRAAEFAVRFLPAGGSMAFLFSRPGPGGVTSGDAAWARLLAGSAERHGLGDRPVALANNATLTLRPQATRGVRSARSAG